MIRLGHVVLIISWWAIVRHSLLLVNLLGLASQLLGTVVLLDVAVTVVLLQVLVVVGEQAISML